MKKGFSLALAGILFLSLYVPATAPEGETVSVIFETDNKEALRDVIENVGGTVTIEYVTVDMIAAEVPLLSMELVLESPHVLHAYKDYIRYIPDFPDVPEGDTDGFATQEIMTTSDGFSGFFWEEDLRDLPDDFCNFMAPGVEDIWYETGAGNETLVAIIDSGIYPWHPLLMYPDGSSRVIGGISFALGEPPDSWDDPDNRPHGTVAAGLVGANGGLYIPSGTVLHGSIMKNAPDSYFPPPVLPNPIYVPLLGMAPLTEFYAIKVFPKTPGGIPRSVVMKGIDHAIEMRQLYDATDGAEGYPIDVINLSLGGGTGYDGNDPEDLLVDEATKAGIAVVAAAGNAGPAFNTVPTPGCSNTSVAVGGTADPMHTRVGYDLVYGIVGIGEYFYPYEDIQVIYFSSRGPTSDGRLAPDVLACGVYVLSSYPPSSIGILSGTSFAAPFVSGEAALLVNWQKMNEESANPYQIRNAIIEGAVPLELPYSEYAQGNGYLNAVNSLDLLQNGIDGGLNLDSSHHLDAVDLNGGYQTWSTGSLGPGLTFDITIAADEDTECLEVCVSNVTFSGPQNPFLGDSIEFYIQGAVRTAQHYYVHSANLYGDYCFTIPHPDPGNIRIVAEGDWTNWGIMSCDVTVTEIEGRENYGGHKETIGHDEWTVHYINVPEGLSAVIFELWWMHNWSKFPTYDLDMYIIDPYGYVYIDGAQFLSPEKQIIENPVPGTYVVLLYGYDIYHGRDPYWLNVYYIE